MAESMRAIQVATIGGPEVLQLVEVAQPTPGPGQVRVRVAAAGLNFIDTYHRTGLYPLALPFTPGLEFAGTIDALGPDVADWAVGDRVATPAGIGGYAEFALAPTAKLVRLPAGVDFKVAAAALLQGLTAHYLAYSTYELRSSDTCVITAAAGGVGLLLIQLAKRLGARVIGLCGNEAKADLARDAGADTVLIYTDASFASQVRELTAGRGADVVYDSVGASTFAASLDSLRPRGMLVSFGNASGPVPPISPLLLSSKGSLFLTRPTLAHYTADAEEFQWRAGDLFRWMAEGQLAVRIDREVPLAQAADAHRALEGRQTTGKVLIVP